MFANIDIIIYNQNFSHTHNIITFIFKQFLLTAVPKKLSVILLNYTIF